MGCEKTKRAQQSNPFSEIASSTSPSAIRF
jgi:hypothetical protein